MKIQVYADPGHAWGKVSIKLLVKLGIADKISSFSYRHGNFAFLEEDCDLSLFQSAMITAGKTIEYQEFCGNKRSRIRNYDSYTFYGVNEDLNNPFWGRR